MTEHSAEVQDDNKDAKTTPTTNPVIDKSWDHQERVKQQYYDRSKLASDNVRKLAYAALAIVWIFKQDGSSGEIILPKTLILAALFSVIALSLDFLQYSIQSGYLGWFQRSWEKTLRLRPETVKREFLMPKWCNWTPIVFFWVKQIAIVICYIFIFSFFISKIS